MDETPTPLYRRQDARADSQSLRCQDHFLFMNPHVRADRGGQVKHR
jgi:hypothetical protein